MLTGSEFLLFHVVVEALGYFISGLETGNDKKSPPNGKETVYNENSIFSEEMNKWQCP
jgi:hypothetical protein